MLANKPRESHGGWIQEPSQTLRLYEAATRVSAAHDEHWQIQ